jgi:hypothetical protein
VDGLATDTLDIEARFLAQSELDIPPVDSAQSAVKVAIAAKGRL